MLDALAKVVLGDRIQLGLLLAGVIGIGLTYWQVRSNARTQRATFLKDLYSTLVSDALICEAYYLIEYDKFRYDAGFHDSELEPKIAFSLLQIWCVSFTLRESLRSMRWNSSGIPFSEWPQMAESRNTSPF